MKLNRYKFVIPVNFAQQVTINNRNRTEHYFQVESGDRIVELGGPEKKLNSTQNTYIPQWVKTAELDEIEFQPNTIVPLIKSKQKNQ
ncbi:MAG: hypothetical protein DWQ05_07055 [Calditrichaeota bacterium]|nr:MAG: hypothetical protein DWQ05_07055 [Calditrichota bacterium]